MFKDSIQPRHAGETDCEIPPEKGRPKQTHTCKIARSFLTTKETKHTKRICARKFRVFRGPTSSPPRRRFALA